MTEKAGMLLAGTVLLLEHGSYSDYQVDGVFRVCRAFDPVEALKLFRASAVPDDDWAPRHFVGWLNREGYIEDAPHAQWHLGDWELKPEPVRIITAREPDTEFRLVDGMPRPA